KKKRKQAAKSGTSVNRILAGSGLVRLHTRFVAIRSLEGKHFRHAGSAVAESRPIFTAAVVLLGSPITRTRRQATRHYLLFRWSIARSQVTRHCVTAGADLGPSLASAGVTTPPANPTLSLRDANGNVTASNNNWKDSQQAVDRKST